MKQVRHEIRLELHEQGYSGSDVDELLPDFLTEHPTVVGITWTSCANGPEAWYLMITIGASICSALAGGFLAELSKDIYSWAKSKIIPLLERKHHPQGTVVITFGTSTVYANIDDAPALALLLDQLSDLLTQADCGKRKREIELVYDSANETWGVLDG